MLLSVIYKCMLFLPTVIFMSFYMYLDQDFHFFLTYLHSMRNFYSTIFFFFFLNKDAITVEFPPQIRFKHYICTFFKAQIWQSIHIVNTLLGPALSC